MEMIGAVKKYQHSYCLCFTKNPYINLLFIPNFLAIMPFLIPNDNLCTLETTRLLELELRMRMYNGIGIVKTK